MTKIVISGIKNSEVTITGGSQVEGVSNPNEDIVIKEGIDGKVEATIHGTIVKPDSEGKIDYKKGDGEVIITPFPEGKR